MSHPWRTLTSEQGVRASHRFLFLSVGIMAIWFSITHFSGGIDSRILLPAALCLSIVIFGAVRYGNERVEIHPWGVVVSSLWTTRRIPWGNISGVFVAAETHPGEEESCTLFVIEDSFDIDSCDDLRPYLFTGNINVPLVGLYTLRGKSPVFFPVATSESASLLVAGFLRHLDDS